MFDRGISSQDKFKWQFKSIQKQSTCCWQIRGPPASQYARAQWQWLSKDKGTQAPESQRLVLDRRTHVLDADKHLRTRTLDLDWSSQVETWYCDQFTTKRVIEFCCWGIRRILALEAYWGTEEEIRMWSCCFLLFVWFLSVTKLLVLIGEHKS